MIRIQAPALRAVRTLSGWGGVFVAIAMLCGCDEPSQRQSSQQAAEKVQAAAISSPASPPSSAAPPTTVPTTLSIDKQYCRLPEQPPSPTASSAEFSEYAWWLFVAVNWPALSGQRGKPDCSKPFASSGQTVWETYKTTAETFLPGAKDPGPWNSTTKATRLLTFQSKAPADLPLENSVRQAVGGWLIDQDKNPTYYEISIDETSYDYIRDNQYYNANVLNQAVKVDFPHGALEIKAAFRILTGEKQRARYHSLPAKVMTFDEQGKPTGQYKDATVGLVGLHLVYKAEGFPQWIWATFEQVDNVTSPEPGTSASYFNPDCTGKYCTPNQSPLASKQPFTIPNQTTRITPLPMGPKAANETWQAKLAGSPFQYYQLISPQWPKDPNDPGNPQGTPTPGTVANITMESYIQPTSSCMDCHSTARVPNGRVKTNYSFVFLFAQAP